uniref:Uncharacterized protein n=1 Tax=Globisporangium ultimum (strain ATCC 200006 / CBS 805.95 / DAOM BR144) TaxID=431595 RepID=K3WG99_GLOUD
MSGATFEAREKNMLLQDPTGMEMHFVLMSSRDTERVGCGSRSRQRHKMRCATSIHASGRHPPRIPNMENACADPASQYCEFKIATLTHFC